MQFKLILEQFKYCYWYGVYYKLCYYPFDLPWYRKMFQKHISIG